VVYPRSSTNGSLYIVESVETENVRNFGFNMTETVIIATTVTVYHRLALTSTDLRTILFYL
jgi:hypothetical protein